MFFEKKKYFNYYFVVDFTFGMISLIGAYIIITSCLLNPHLRQFPYKFSFSLFSLFSLFLSFLFFFVFF